MSGYLRRLALQAAGEAPAVHSMARLRSRGPAQTGLGELAFDDGRAPTAAAEQANDRRTSLGAPSADEAPAGEGESAVSVEGKGIEGSAPIGEASTAAPRPEAFEGEASTSSRRVRSSSGPSAPEPSSPRDPEIGMPARLMAHGFARERWPGRSARASGRSDAPAAGAGAAALPDVHIHIGRVELAALLPTPPAASAVPPTKGKPPMSLDEYFRNRGRRAP